MIGISSSPAIVGMTPRSTESSWLALLDWFRRRLESSG